MGVSDNPATSFYAAQVFLYNPDQELIEREVDIAAFGLYIKMLVASCVTAFAEVTVPERLDVVAAVLPEGKCRVWFVSERQAGDDTLVALRRVLESTSPIAVRNGPVVFALSGAVGGRKPRGAPPSHPVPAEWRAISEWERLTLDDLVLRVCAETA